jgi:uncharacterized protein (DUF1501 family)
MRTPCNLTRRRFLLNSGALAATAAIPNALFAHTGGAARLVVVILRGALDGLAAVPPYADPDYRGIHRELAIAAPGAADGALTLDNTFRRSHSCMSAISPENCWCSMPSPRRIAIARISTGKTCSRTD